MREKPRRAPLLTFLIPDDLEAREVKLLQAITNRIVPTDDCAYATTWDEVEAAGSLWVVAVGKQGVQAFHDWGMILVSHAHGVVFRHGYHAVMVIEHPGGGFQRTAWGYGVKENIRDEVATFNACRLGLADVDELLGHWCVKCLKGKPSRTRAVDYFFHDADWIGLCEDHWRGRAKITHRARARKPNPSSRAAQISGQLELGPRVKVKASA